MSNALWNSTLGKKLQDGELPEVPVSVWLTNETLIYAAGYLGLTALNVFLAIFLIKLWMK